MFGRRTSVEEGLRQLAVAMLVLLAALVFRTSWIAFGENSPDALITGWFPFFLEIAAYVLLFLGTTAVSRDRSAFGPGHGNAVVHARTLMTVVVFLFVLLGYVVPFLAAIPTASYRGQIARAGTAAAIAALGLTLLLIVRHLVTRSAFVRAALAIPPAVASPLVLGIYWASRWGECGVAARGAPVNPSLLACHQAYAALFVPVFLIAFLLGAAAFIVWFWALLRASYRLAPGTAKAVA